MARIATDPNYSSPTFPRATAGTDLFLKEDVQALAAAVSTHDHSTGKGVALTAGAIPNGTITSAMIVDGTIATADLADGSVTTAKHADASVTNAKLASDTARASLLTNGGFEIWQRGNGPFTTGVHAADRWQLQIEGTDTLSVSRDVTNMDTGSGVCAATVFTKGTGSVDTRLQQKVEDLPQLKNRVVAFSIRVRTSTANAVRPAIFNGSWIYGAYHSGGGAWETLTLSLTVTTSSQVIVAPIFNASCTAYIDNAMLVVGSVPADYAPLHPADDLARCLRYYEAIGLPAGNEVLVGGYGAAGTIWWTPFQYRAPKAVTPTLTKNGTWGATNCSQPSVVTNTTYGFGIQTGVTATGGFSYQNNAAGTNFTAEANP